MRTAAKAVGLWMLVLAGAAVAADAPFTGVFKGSGRACSGGLYVRAKTIEWNASFNKCKPTRYETLDRNPTPGHERVAMMLKNRSKSCPFEVIEVKQTDEWGWMATGYQSLESYQKRDLPDWKDSVLEGREVLECSVNRMKRAGSNLLY